MSGLRGIERSEQRYKFVEGKPGILVLDERKAV